MKRRMRSSGTPHTHGQAGAALRVGILGAGAVGCYVGGRLAAHGAAVTLLGRPYLVEELGAHGLVLEDLNGTATPAPAGAYTVETDPAALGQCQVVLVCVKSAHTPEAGRQLAQLPGPQPLVVSLQNGVNNAEVLREALPNAEVLGGIVGFNVRPLGQGRFRQATSGALVIEHGAHEALEPLVQLFRLGGFEMLVSREIVRVQWSKLMMNLNNAISALSGATTADLLGAAGYRRILAALIGESLAVLSAAGIQPARLGPLPVKLFPLLLRLPTPIFRVLARAQLRVDPQARSSMWEDLHKKRDTEVDFLNGAVVGLAQGAALRPPSTRGWWNWCTRQSASVRVRRAWPQMRCGSC